MFTRLLTAKRRNIHTSSTQVFVPLQIKFQMLLVMIAKSGDAEINIRVAYS